MVLCCFRDSCFRTKSRKTEAELRHRKNCSGEIRSIFINERVNAFDVEITTGFQALNCLRGRVFAGLCVAASVRSTRGYASAKRGLKSKWKSDTYQIC